jgi:hypothetical protein
LAPGQQGKSSGFLGSYRREFCLPLRLMWWEVSPSRKKPTHQRDKWPPHVWKRLLRFHCCPDLLSLNHKDMRPEVWPKCDHSNTSDKPYSQPPPQMSTSAVLPTPTEPLKGTVMYLKKSRLHFSKI